MRGTFALLAFTALLVACGQGGGAGAPEAVNSSNEACALIENAGAIFGEGVQTAATPGDAPIAQTCQFTSADGTRSGEVLLFTAQSLGAVTPEAQLTALSEAWDSSTETALAPVENFAADQSVLAKDLPGYQVQIAFRKGAAVVAVQGSSGDSAMSAEQIARGLANAALAKLPTA